jgi:hypothetical protein
VVYTAINSPEIETYRSAGLMWVRGLPPTL